MYSILSQEDALKKVLTFQEKMREGHPVSTNYINEFLSGIEHHLKESLDWTAGIHELGD